MDCWTLLGLTPTADERAVLRAYARKLRETRPEDDPEGFQRLLAAREQALAWRPRAAPPPEPGADEAGAASVHEPAVADPPVRTLHFGGAAPEGDDAGRGEKGTRRPDWRVPAAPSALPPEDEERRGGGWRDRRPPPAVPPERGDSGRPLWRAGRPVPLLPPPERPARPEDEDAGWTSRRIEFEPPPAAALPELDALRARWAALGREDERAFWDLAAWEEILSRAGALSILDREIARRELATLIGPRLPPLAGFKGRPPADIIAVLGRLSEEFDLTRAPPGAKRASTPNLAGLADWLNAVAASREMTRRRARGWPAYRSEAGVPLIPADDRPIALGTRELIEDYDHWLRARRRRWRAHGRIAWRAVIVPSVVCLNLDAPRLATLIMVFDFATIFLAAAAASTADKGGALWAQHLRDAAQAAVPLTAFLATRLAAIYLWPPFALGSAVRRVRRADLAGLPLPAARKFILSRRFNNRWYARPLAIFGGLADLLALVLTLGVVGALLGPQR
jgi:hypothetical protein